ncbi:hypothetical protein ACFPER_04895 [Agromyces aurantiacus]|uniref:EF-hand domain-containing protein n=1 Tax=Agromyces aurantiacus TaxID=165814 RepID=A0ABV9R720_9MICO|nr:hypothetical protein [Agromyces aurantiacus]MBM7502795.1 hypothetical protein [Agromyces aurantiacus]
MLTRISRTALTAAAAAALVLAPAAAHAAGSGGVTGPAFYVDGDLYRTVATPNDLSSTGAPSHAFDVIYAFGGEQPNVATAAPGDTDYNGGRWMVHALAFPMGYAAAVAAGDTDGDGVIDSDAELMSAIAAGAAVDTGVVRSFTCPVIPLHG